MCGIAGIVRPEGAPCEDNLRRMVAALRHRGPDASGVLDVDRIALLGHARLSIIDLSDRAAQPMTDASGRYTLTYNGEIYNYRELRTELRRRGHEFRSESDTEVLVEGYAEWRADVFRRLNGMFAVAIWDRKERELVLARDPFGEKPLHHAVFGDAFVFASELRAFEHAPGFVQRRPSVTATNHFLALGYIPAPNTFHPDVLKLEPATYLVHRPGRRPVTQRYWEYADAFRSLRRGKKRDLSAELRAEVTRAVSVRLVADVPVGALLSGGLDSSTVAAVARNHLPYPLHTFNVGFESKSYDESPDARRVAEALGATHHEYVMDDAGGRRLTQEAIDVYDDPLSDTSIVPTLLVSRLAARQVKVVLGGDGADEIFGGYDTYRADLLRWSLDPLPRIVREGLLPVAAALPTGTGKTNVGFKLRRFARGLPLEYRRAHYSWREIHGEDERVAMLGPSNASEVRETDPFFAFERYYAEVSDLDPLSQHLYVDAKTWLADDILVKLDRATMSVSLEARLPFLDRQLAEFAAGMRPSLKVSPFRGKRILREAVKSVVPRSAIEKRKSGFNAPVHVWFPETGFDEHRLMNVRIAADRFGVSTGGAGRLGGGAGRP